MRRPRSRYWWVEMGCYGVLRDERVTLWRVGWNGSASAVVEFEQLGRVGRDLLSAVERECERMLTKGAGRRVTGSAGEVVTDPEWSVLYPCLFDHLTQVVWPDGTVRQTSSLSMFADGSVVKCVLKDREAGVCLWAASKSFQELFGVLEALLNDPAAEWRVDRVVAGQKASRVKK